MDHNQPKWAIKGESTKKDLSILLNHATTNYGKHTDWFVRHKEFGVKILAVILTAEVTITGFYFTKDLPSITAIAPLIILSILSPILAYYSIVSCRQAYKASLENALLSTKALWAMGVTKPIIVNPNEVDFDKCPVPNDETPYVPRFLEFAVKYNNSQEFIEKNLVNKGNTFYTAKLITQIFGAIGFLTGIGATIVVFFYSLGS